MSDSGERMIESIEELQHAIFEMLFPEALEEAQSALYCKAAALSVALAFGLPVRPNLMKPEDNR